MEETKFLLKDRNLSNDAKEATSIEKFLVGKTIFLTGATGFVGQCLIERLLSATSKIVKIYVLVRAKNNFSAESRIQRLLSKNVSYFKISLKQFLRNPRHFFIVEINQFCVIFLMKIIREKKRSMENINTTV